MADGPPWDEANKALVSRAVQIAPTLERYYARVGEQRRQRPADL